MFLAGGSGCWMVAVAKLKQGSKSPTVQTISNKNNRVTEEQNQKISILFYFS